MSDSIAALAERISHHRKLYYEGNPEIDDIEYDVLESKLKKLAPGHPLLTSVGDTPSTFAKVQHAVPMLSLDKCYEDDQLLSWARIRPAGDAGYITMPKLDGFAVSLTYSKLSPNTCTRLLHAESRGDGRVGEDITQNARQCLGVPELLVEVPTLPKTFEVRGEVILQKSDFVNLGLADQGFKNCRNTAAGTIRHRDPRVVRKRKLVFIPYSIVVHEGSGPDTHSEALQLLKSHGFTPIPFKIVPENELVQNWRSIAGVHKSFPYDIDGMVVGVNDLVTQHGYGYTAHHPRGLIACKFEAESATTVLEDIQWQVSRTGLINPVALFEPVELDGASIAKATLHNLSEIERLGIRYRGTQVVVERRGGVIPAVTAVQGTPETSTELIPPAACPECGKPTEIRTSEDGVRTLHCPNMLCPAAVMSRILHYIKCMGIDGIGEGVLGRMMDRGLVKSVIDIYHLDSKDLQILDKVGKTLGDKIVNEIWDKSQSADPDKFIWALGIPGVGRATAERLAQRFSVSDLFDVEVSDLCAVEGIEDKSARAIHKFLSGDGVRKFYTQACIPADTVPAPVVFKKEAPEPGSNSLSGMSFVLSGTLSVPRKDIEEIITRNGGVLKTSVSKRVTYLVAGDNPGSKLDKAESRGVHVINEDELREMVSGADTVSDSKPDSESQELEQLSFVDAQGQVLTSNTPPESQQGPMSDLEPGLWEGDW